MCYLENRKGFLTSHRKAWSVRYCNQILPRDRVLWVLDNTHSFSRTYHLRARKSSLVGVSQSQVVRRGLFRGSTKIHLRRPVVFILQNTPAFSICSVSHFIGMCQARGFLFWTHEFVARFSRCLFSTESSFAVSQEVYIHW